MAKHVIRTSPYKFFCSNADQLLKIGLIGVLLGVVSLVLASWLSFDSMLVNFRVGLVLMSVGSIALLLSNQVESALLITSLTVVVLWHQWLQLSEFWQAALFYGVLGGLTMALFGWIAQLSHWRLRLMISMVVMLVLVLI